MTSPPPFLDRPTPELQTWFTTPAHEAWEAAVAAGKDARPAASLARPVAGIGPVPILHGPAAPAAVPWRAGRWDVRPVYDTTDVTALAAAITADQRAGASSVGLVPTGALRGLGAREGGTRFGALADLEQALSGVNLLATPIAIEAGSAPALWTAGLAALAKKRGTPVFAVRGAVHACALSVLVRHGQLSGSVDAFWDELAATLRWAEATGSPLHLVTLDARTTAEAGGAAVDQLTWAIASAHAALKALSARGIRPEVVAQHAIARVDVGLDLFTGIALVRALRLVWARLLGAVGVHDAPLYVHAIGAPHELTRLDVPTNLVRTSLQGFAAAVGGANAITLLPWDRLQGAPGAASSRAATTSQAVLALEAGLAGDVDPAAGSGLVEALTAQLAAAAWADAVAIDDAGGLAHAVTSGAWAARIAARRATTELSVRTRKRPILGVSLHPAAEAEAPSRGDDAPQAATTSTSPPRDLQATITALLSGAAFADLLPAPVATTSAPAAGVWLISSSWDRLAERAAATRSLLGRAPTAALVPVGAGGMVRARQDFAAELLGLAGFEVTRGLPAEGSDVAVLCGPDDALAEAPLPPARVLAVAVPKGPVADALLTRGVSVLLHRGCDVVDALTRLLVPLTESSS